MLASACARLASFCASCVSSIERSSTASTSPFFTKSPSSALSAMTVMPLRSVPASASSRATMVPLTDSFSTRSRVSAATTRIAGGAGALATGAASLGGDSRARPRCVGSAAEASSAASAKGEASDFSTSGLLFRRYEWSVRRWLCRSGLQHARRVEARAGFSILSSGTPRAGRSLRAMPVHRSP